MENNQSPPTLPIPQSLSATQKAKVGEDALPVGGAPPVPMPSFEEALGRRRATPRHVEEQQLPRQGGPNPPRSPEEIKADMEKATALFSKGQVTDPNNPPDPSQAATLPDVAPNAQSVEIDPQGHIAHDPMSIPAQGNIPQPQQPQQQQTIPTPEIQQKVVEEAAKDVAGVDDDGPTLGDLRDYPWKSYSNAMQREADYQRDDVREAIEARLKDVDVSDMILYESVSQLHPIIPGRLEVDLRTLTPEEDLYIKNEVYAIEGSDRYVLDKMVLYTLTMGLKTFNGREMPDHMTMVDGERQVDVDKLAMKTRIVTRIPIQVVSLMSVVYGWFDNRMRRKLVSGVLGKL